MLNSIQRTSNYQNSRPNFGMALTSTLAADLISQAGTSTKKLNQVLALAKRAAENQDVHLSPFRNGTVLLSNGGSHIELGTYVPGTKFRTIEKQVRRAEEIRTPQQIINQIQNLIVDLRYKGE